MRETTSEDFDSEIYNELYEAVTDLYNGANIAKGVSLEELDEVVRTIQADWSANLPKFLDGSKLSLPTIEDTWQGHANLWESAGVAMEDFRTHQPDVYLKASIACAIASVDAEIGRAELFIHVWSHRDEEFLNKVMDLPLGTGAVVFHSYYSIAEAKEAIKGYKEDREKLVELDKSLKFKWRLE